MALAIATNNAALRAAASASSVNRDMETSMARLSSGKRIIWPQMRLLVWPLVPVFQQKYGEKIRLSAPLLLARR